MSGLVLENLGKRYGAKAALQGVSATWPQGSMVALVGANGGGKSTLLKILAGVMEPDEGTIRGLEGTSVAYMPDRLAFARGWTAHSWLSMVASWKGAARSQVKRVLEEAELDHVARKPVATFSQGMQRRLLYAQTRLTTANLVLLDEPEGGLDPEWTARLETELDRLRGEGRTVVLSTHWLDLAIAHTDILAILAEGRLLSTEAAQDWRSLDPSARRQNLVHKIQGARP